MNPSSEKLYQIAEKTVEDALRRLPPELRGLAVALPVSFEDRPSDDLQEDPDLDGDLLGLFVGDPYGETGDTLHPIPAQILLFLANIWDAVEGDETSFRNEVRITYLHELGHYFGWDETDLFDRGLD